MKRGPIKSTRELEEQMVSNPARTVANTTSPINSMPNEILDKIFSFLGLTSQLHLVSMRFYEVFVNADYTPAFEVSDDISDNLSDDISDDISDDEVDRLLRNLRGESVIRPLADGSTLPTLGTFIDELNSQLGFIQRSLNPYEPVLFRSTFIPNYRPDPYRPGDLETTTVSRSGGAFELFNRVTGGVFGLFNTGTEETHTFTRQADSEGNPIVTLNDISHEVSNIPRMKTRSGKLNFSRLEVNRPLENDDNREPTDEEVLAKQKRRHKKHD